MRETYSRQYDLPCIIADRTDPAQVVIDRCHTLGAVRKLDGIEYVVQLRPEIGPELWTDESLRASLPAPLPAGYKALAGRQVVEAAELQASLAAPLEVGTWVDVDGKDDLYRVVDIKEESGQVGVVTSAMWDADITMSPAYVEAARVRRNVMMTLMPPPVD